MFIEGFRCSLLANDVCIELLAHSLITAARVDFTDHGVVTLSNLGPL